MSTNIVTEAAHPFTTACLRYSTEPVEGIVINGTDVHIEDHDGLTHLHIACTYGWLISLLVGHPQCRQ